MNSLATQLFDIPCQSLHGAAERFERRDLRANVRAQSLPANPFRMAMSQVQSLRLCPIQAKLMFVPARRNVRMATGLHVGIHSNRRRRWTPAFLLQGCGVLR